MANTLPNRSISSDSYRVIRGGSWSDVASFVRAGQRNYDTPDGRNRDIGFRPVFVAQEFLTAAVPVAPVAPVVPAAPAAPAAPVQSAPPDRSTSSASDRVSRGGSWSYGASFVRAGRRVYRTPGYRDGYFGFRPVFIADEFIGVNVPMAQPARAAQAAQAAPAAPAAPAPRAPAPPAPPAPPPVPPVPQMTNIVTSSNYKKLYLTRPTAQFNIDPAVRMSILNSRSFRADGVRFDQRATYRYYFGSMLMPLHDQDNYFYLMDLVGTQMDHHRNYGPTIFGWTGTTIPILKTGYLDSYDQVYHGDQYTRAHSPGDKSFMPGLGMNVYAAGSLLAAFQGKAGIHSRKRSRSTYADAFWKRAVDTGFAAEQGQQEFISAEKVLKSPLYVRYPGMETEFSVGSQTKAYFTTAYPFSSQPPDFAYDGKAYMSVSKTFKATPAVRKLRAEMLARSAFAISSDSVQRVYSLLQDIGIQSEMDLFRSRPEVNGTQGLAGLRHRRLPPLSGESQQLLNGISNPY